MMDKASAVVVEGYRPIGQPVDVRRLRPPRTGSAIEPPVTVVSVVETDRKQPARPTSDQ